MQKFFKHKWVLTAAVALAGVYLSIVIYLNRLKKWAWKKN